MLQSMRQGAQSITAKIIIGLIVLSFAAFGLETLIPSGSGTSVAEVNGEEISPFALQEAITLQKRRLIEVLGENVAPTLLNDELLQPIALESLIQRTLLLQKSSDFDLVASPAQISQVITAFEAFRINGEFSSDTYRSVLANAGYTAERFRRAQSEDIQVTQIERAISDTEFVTEIEAIAMANFAAEERDVRYLLAPSEKLVSPKDLSTEALISYYNQNSTDFSKPEQVIVEYIFLDTEDFLSDVDEGLVREQFEAVKGEYEVTEKSWVSHILIAQRNEESDADYRSRIQDVQDRLLEGDNFADLAILMSDDLGSAGNGGELGFTAGSTFPTAMEEAITALTSIGEISSPIETDAGTHIIRLDDRIAAEIPDYQTLEDELRASIQASEAERKLLLAVEELRDLVFTAQDLLEPAKKIGAKVQRSVPFSKESGYGLFTEERVRLIAFSADVLTAGNNSEVIELSDKQFLVLRLHELLPPHVVPFEKIETEVSSSLRRALEATQIEKLQTESEDMLGLGKSLEEVSNLLGLEWRVELAATRFRSLLPTPILDEVFRMAEGDPNQLSVVEIPAEGFALVQLARVTPGSFFELNNQESEALREQRAVEQQQLIFNEFLSHQRKAADILIR